MKGFTSKILHSDRLVPIEHGALHKPVHTSVAYGHESAQDIAEVFQGKKKGFTYARQINPTVAALERKITLMEQGVDTACFATGMAAITAIFFAVLRSGDHLISSQFLFGNTNSLLHTIEHLGIEVSFVDATDADAVAAAIRPNTRAVFVETIANPATQVADLKGIGTLCAEKNLLYIVDNTMTSPWLFQPARVGAGLVVNSLTKFIAGHGDVLGGSVTDTGRYDWSHFPHIYDIYKKGPPQAWGLLQIRKKGLRDTGGALSAMAAHQISIGAETLALRQDRAADNALTLARFFEGHPSVARVYYPGLPSHPQHERAIELFRSAGSLMSIDLQEGVECFDVLDALRLPVIATNLGDTRTLALPVAQTIYYEMGAKRRASMGISDGMIRLSIGIEDIEDLLDDFRRALDR